MKITRIKSGSIKINTVSANIHGSKLAVVFIHGFPFNKDIWEEQLKSLPDEVEGIAYDVRGHGRSSSGHGYFSVDLFAKDLLQLIKDLKLRKVILCGISMGGYIALRAMELSPELIHGLILSDTHSLTDTNEVKLGRFAQIETIMTKGKEVFADDSIKKLFSAGALEKKSPAADLIREIILQNREKNICATLLALASRTDTTPVLKNINVPTLIMRGDEDQIISAEQVKILHQEIKGSELVTISHSGHLPNLDNKEQFNAALVDFISNHFLK